MATADTPTSTASHTTVPYHYTLLQVILTVSTPADCCPLSVLVATTPVTVFILTSLYERSHCLAWSSSAGTPLTPLVVSTTYTSSSTSSSSTAVAQDSTHASYRDTLLAQTSLQGPLQLKPALSLLQRLALEASAGHCYCRAVEASTQNNSCRKSVSARVHSTRSCYDMSAHYHAPRRSNTCESSCVQSQLHGHLLMLLLLPWKASTIRLHRVQSQYLLAASLSSDTRGAAIVCCQPRASMMCRALLLWQPSTSGIAVGHRLSGTFRSAQVAKKALSPSSCSSQRTAQRGPVSVSLQSLQRQCDKF
eukprot:8408-Heterococcus_DN1.PRE.3